MSAGRGGGGVSVCLTLHIVYSPGVYSPLIFIDVCMGEDRTASWRNL